MRRWGFKLLRVLVILAILVSLGRAPAFSDDASEDINGPLMNYMEKVDVAHEHSGVRVVSRPDLVEFVANPLGSSPGASNGKFKVGMKGSYKAPFVLVFSWKAQGVGEGCSLGNVMGGVELRRKEARLRLWWENSGGRGNAHIALRWRGRVLKEVSLPDPFKGDSEYKVTLRVLGCTLDLRFRGKDEDRKLSFEVPFDFSKGRWKIYFFHPGDNYDERCKKFAEDEVPYLAYIDFYNYGVKEISVPTVAVKEKKKPAEAKKEASKVSLAGKRTKKVEVELRKPRKTPGSGPTPVPSKRKLAETEASREKAEGVTKRKQEHSKTKEVFLPSPARRREVSTTAKVAQAKVAFPYLDLTFVKLIDSNSNGILEAGEQGSLVVKISNRGKGEARNMVLTAKGAFVDVSIPIDHLRPGGEVVEEIPFRVPEDVKTGILDVVLALEAGKFTPSPIKLALALKAAPPPKFKITYRIDDDMIGESIGNGDGRVEPRETIELRLTVENVGEGTAKGTVLVLSSKDVDVVQGTARLGRLPPGAKATAKFVFFTPATLNKGRVAFDLAVREERGAFRAGTRLVMKVFRPGERTYRYAVKVKAGGGGERPSIEVTGLSSPGSKCVRSFPNRYFLGVVVYDYDELQDLGYVKNDASLVKKTALCYLGVPEDNFKLLRNPSYADLKRELRKFVRRVKGSDSLLYFYYSGHGITDSRGRFYMLPMDASIEDETALRDSGIDMGTLKALLGRAKGRKVAFIDACRVEAPWKPAVLERRPNLVDMTVIFSTAQGQASNRDRSGMYSAFTEAIYRMASSGLKNLDMDDSGYVEVRELERPLMNWLKEVSASSNQRPEVWGDKRIPVFPVY